jgi:tRNA(fMet)-specific endonuclease VapC
MTLRYLLDTSFLSRAIAPRPVVAVLEWLRLHDAESGTGAPVLHEMRYGSLRLPPSHRRTDIERFIQNSVLARLTILPYDERAAEWHARQRARLATIGRTPPYVDGQIAAIAATNGLVLVTANVADFSDFQGLQIADWSVTGQP